MMASCMLSPSTQEPSGEERNSRYSQFAFSDEGFHDNAVVGRRRLSSALAGELLGPNVCTMFVLYKIVSEKIK